MLGYLGRMGSLGVLFAVCTLPVLAAPADGDRVAKLVAQLGNDQFRVRESASKELDAIGEPALDAIAEAMKSEDMEVRRRANDLHTKISLRALNARRIAPTIVELSFRDAPLVVVVAELGKQGTMRVVLQDPTGELGKRRVTIATGKVPFWQALDLVCSKGDVAEADALANVTVPAPAVGRPIRPIIRAMPAPIQIPIPAPVPVPVPVAPPAKEVPQKAVPKQGVKKDPVAPPPVRVQIQVQVQAQVVQIQVAPAAPAMIFNTIGSPVPNPVAPVITLVDAGGKLVLLPTHYEGAVRVRALSADRAKAMNAATIDQIAVAIQPLAEAKLQWQNLVSFKIDRAIDDQGQELAPVENDAARADPNAGDTIVVNNGQVVRMMRVRQPFGSSPPVAVAGQQPFAIRVQKGAKPSSVLRELSGTLTAQVRTPNEALATVLDVMKPKPVAVAGQENCSLKVLKSEKRDNGEIHIDFEVNYSTQIVPGVANAPANVPNMVGLSLHDADGGAFQVVQALPRQQHYTGHSVKMIGVATFRPTKEGQTAAKLAFNGSAPATVDIPFVLKDVPVK